MQTTIISLLLAGGVVSSPLAQELPTTGTIASRLGTLDLLNGSPAGR